VGECVTKPLPTGDQTHHFQCIKWESYVASPKIGTPSCFFPFVASPSFVLLGGFQGTEGGALANHELPNQKFADKHQLFMYYDLAQQRCLPICANLWIPSTTASLLLKPEALCCPSKMVLAQNFDTIC